MSALRACLLLVLALLAGCASAPAEEVEVERARIALERIPEYLTPGPRPVFSEMRSGDALRGRVRSTGCWNLGRWTMFVCEAEGPPGERPRAWRFRVGSAEGQVAPPFSVELELALDAIDVLDLDWELGYVRGAATGIESTSKLEYWLEWWRDGELIAEEHHLDDSGGSERHPETLTLHGLWEYCFRHPEELRVDPAAAFRRRRIDRFGD